jgi:mycothiol synthase
MENITSNTLDLILPEGFRWRAPSMDDLEAVTQLIQVVDLADIGETDFNENDLRMEWEKTDFNPEEDSWVVETAPDENGVRQIVGYEELWNRSQHSLLDGDGYVNPDYRGLGIGTVLLRLLEQRARHHLTLAEPDLRVGVRNGMSARDEAGRRLHENEGYKPIRYFYKMQINLEGEPDEQNWPAGVELRPYQPGQERMIFEATEEAFRDHWGYTPWNYERWLKRNYQQDDFDPGLQFLAWAGDEIAGVSLCRMRPEGGWVFQLGVRRPWRQQGLGMSLLRHTFLEFYRRGIARVELGVDAASQTGATRLYERAGMHPVHEFVVYEKELRPGRVPGGEQM